MIELIQEKLTAYNAANNLEENHAVKEILQDIALYIFRVCVAILKNSDLNHKY